MPIGSLNKKIRQLSQRVGRKIYCIARGDFHNTPASNGEYWILDKMIKSCIDGAYFFDIGANKGDWSDHALMAAKKEGKSINILAFEPSSATRALLSDRFKDIPTVYIIPAACSSEVGKLSFFSNSVGSGTNSLSDISGEFEETVDVNTVDNFLSQKAIPKINFVKIDTEGFDFKVLMGAENALSRGDIEVVQFEYNWRWLVNHYCLRDVFNFIEDKPYKFGKLMGNKIVIFNKWHFELDRFFENNYLLIHKDHDLLLSSETSDVNESNTY